MVKNVSWNDSDIAKDTIKADKSTKRKVDKSTNRYIDIKTGIQPKGRYTKKDGSELKKITFYLTPELIKKLKSKCVDSDMNMSTFVQKTLETIFL